MTRVRLASWFEGRAPGELIDVPDDRVRPLTRDGRIAEVLPGEPELAPAEVAEADSRSEGELADEATEAPADPPRRSRRGSS